MYAGAPLQEALASVREQEAAARIIIVDNASDEPLGEVGDAEAVRAPKRLTVGGARNLGLERVSTPYALFWDVDDVMLPGTLHFLVEAISTDASRVGLAAGIVEEDGSRHRWPPGWSAARAAAGAVPARPLAVIALPEHRRHDHAAAVRESGGFDADEGSVSTEDGCSGCRSPIVGASSCASGRGATAGSASRWEDHRAPARQLAHARAVCERLRADPGIPRWARSSALALKVLHPADCWSPRPDRPFHRVRNR